MNLWLGLVAVFVNLAAVGVMLFLEAWYSKRKEIRPRAKNFFYLIDYKTIVWGDVLGLSLIDFGVLASLGPDFFEDSLLITISIFIALAVTWAAHKIWISPGHPPSLTYPESGKSNIVTSLHLVYFFAHVLVAMAGLRLMFAGSMSANAEWVVFLGIIVYAISLGADAKDGKF